MKKPNLSRTLHRGLAMILAFALLLGMLPAAVQAAPASSDGGPAWRMGRSSVCWICLTRKMGCKKRS